MHVRAVFVVVVVCVRYVLFVMVFLCGMSCVDQMWLICWYSEKFRVSRKCTVSVRIGDGSDGMGQLDRRKDFLNTLLWLL